VYAGNVFLIIDKHTSAFTTVAVQDRFIYQLIPRIFELSVEQNINTHFAYRWMVLRIQRIYTKICDPKRLIEIGYLNSNFSIFYSESYVQGWKRWRLWYIIMSIQYFRDIVYAKQCLDGIATDLKRIFRFLVVIKYTNIILLAQYKIPIPN
jgi:hypothetical protein